MKYSRFFLLPALVLCTAGSVARAGTDVDSKSVTATSAQDTRYGLFGWLDHRSSYGEGVYPEPFTVDDSDLETNEFRLDWLTQRAPGRERDDFFTGEIEKGFGNLTLELEFHYTATSVDNNRTSGFDNTDIGARYPIFEYVSSGGTFDTTFGVAGEIGLPMDSEISKDSELVPKVFNDTKIGNFTLQTIVGYSVLVGPDDDAGSHTFEYGIVAGYSIQKPLPGVEQLIPVFELSGEDPLNKDDRGHNSLTGNIALRVNLRAIGRIQPRLGFGYVFPINRASGQGLERGFFTSLVFEY